MLEVKSVSGIKENQGVNLQGVRPRCLKLFSVWCWSGGFV